ncbi:MAG: DUF5689 domain-containing protein [Phycisphaerales bacterium]|nr:DUF5689 domain-containing protein [Phycisphaerales bacterium]
MPKFTVYFILFFLIGISCFNKFASPPYASDPNVAVTRAIQSLQDAHQTPNTIDSLTDEDVISGVVIGNDQSGNLYQSLVIQDNSGGICLKVNGSNLYTAYPIGRRVFVKLKELFVGDYNGLLQVGSGVDTTNGYNTVTAIPYALLDKYILKGSLNNIITPIIVSPKDLSTGLNCPYQNCLVQLNKVEFSPNDTGSLYADPTKELSALSYGVSNCNGDRVYLRTSSYANFASAQLPGGNGSLTGIFMPYGSSKQIYIRSVDDINFNGVRCDQGAPPTPITIAQLLQQYQNKNTAIGNHVVYAVVISDPEQKNLPNGMVVVQDQTAAMPVYMPITVDLNLGDSVAIDLSNDSLVVYQGYVEIKRTSNSLNPVVLSQNNFVQPVLLSIEELRNSLPQQNFLLVQLLSCTIAPNTTYVGYNNLTDYSGNTMSLYTFSQATFANSMVPSTPQNIVGYGFMNNGQPQFMFRNLSDVTPAIPMSLGIDLGNVAPYNIYLDTLYKGLPLGLSVRTDATANFLGTSTDFIGTPSSWSNKSGGFKNYASPRNLPSNTPADDQNTTPTRCWGIRQVSTNGTDPGAAFVLKINNTMGKENLHFSFVLYSLDSNADRITYWEVDYCIGEQPSSFKVIPQDHPLISGNGIFGNTHVAIDFAHLLDNQKAPVWIRIVNLTPTAGTGTRAATAIDSMSINFSN